MSKSRKTKQFDADGYEYRVVVSPECEPYDDSYIDTWTDETEKHREKARAKLWRRIEQDGVWHYAVERRHKDAPVACSHCQHQPAHAWEHVDSVGMCVGDEGMADYMLPNIPRGVEAAVYDGQRRVPNDGAEPINTVVGTAKPSKRKVQS